MFKAVSVGTKSLPQNAKSLLAPDCGWRSNGSAYWAFLLSSFCLLWLPSIVNRPFFCWFPLCPSFIWKRYLSELTCPLFQLLFSLLDLLTVAGACVSVHLVCAVLSQVLIHVISSSIKIQAYCSIQSSLMLLFHSQRHFPSPSLWHRITTIFFLHFYNFIISRMFRKRNHIVGSLLIFF